MVVNKLSTGDSLHKDKACYVAILPRLLDLSIIYSPMDTTNYVAEV